MLGYIRIIAILIFNYVIDYVGNKLKHVTELLTVTQLQKLSRVPDRSKGTQMEFCRTHWCEKLINHSDVASRGTNKCGDLISVIIADVTLNWFPVVFILSQYCAF